VKELAASPSLIEHVPAREEEIAQRCPNITKAEALLRWHPKVSLTEGLQETIAWFRDELAKPHTAPRPTEGPLLP
jgi:nucleoside-diphosphate-sugar epimerase